MDDDETPKTPLISQTDAAFDDLYGGDIPSTPPVSQTDTDLGDLYEGDYSEMEHGLYSQRTARQILGQIDDPALRHLTIRISKMVFPEPVCCTYRVNTLEYLFEQKSIINSLPTLQKVFALLEEKKASYEDLGYEPRLEKVKALLQERFPSKINSRLFPSGNWMQQYYHDRFDRDPDF